MAPSYPQFYGGSAQVPTRDADFEAWHGPINVVPQQQQQVQQPQQHPGLLPAPDFQLPPPSFAGALGMPELPQFSGSQVWPLAFSQLAATYDARPAHLLSGLLAELP